MLSGSAGYLGPEGTWTEDAVVQFSNVLRRKPYSNICSIVEEVDSGNLDYGVIPIENSIGGGVVDTLDCLSNSTNVKIIAEEIMEINHVLMSTGNIGEIRTIMSHQNAISQCRKSINRILPKVKVQFSSSTSEAGRIAGQDKSVGVVGSRRLCELYGLSILSENMSDQRNNYTRFVLIGKAEADVTGKDRTSICVTLKKNEYASLWRFLGIFAALKINLSRVESRPDPVSPGEYKFFIDLFGHWKDEPVRIAIKAAEQYCTSITVMGSYPREDWPREG